MNVVLLVVDSMRAGSLGGSAADAPAVPFMERLGRETINFRRAYASECWTLPTHVSIFTGLLPSQHGAHFRNLAYAGAAPALAERFAAAGYQTDVFTRNSLLDGTIPGATRGFQRNTRILAELRWPDPLGVLLAVSKPRVRRLIRTSGFFHVLQRDDGQFLRTLSRMIIPADARLLTHTLDLMTDLRRNSRPYFLCLNLYDIHAPYPPRANSPLRSFRTLDGWIENFMLPRLSTQLGAHAYLRTGFAFSPRAQHILRMRYHRAIELMDGKLATFYDAARGAGLLDDTVLVVVADHGEAFGEHDLYFHDASVYQTHLHVPLWIHHPGHPAATVDEVVSTRGLYDLLSAVAEGHSTNAALPPARGPGCAPSARAPATSIRARPHSRRSRRAMRRTSPQQSLGAGRRSPGAMDSSCTISAPTPTNGHQKWPTSPASPAAAAPTVFRPQPSRRQCNTWKPGAAATRIADRTNRLRLLSLSARRRRQRERR
jgi:hypothetical protein